MKKLAPFIALALVLAVPGDVSAAARSKPCPRADGLRVGSFYVSDARARAVTCRTAVRIVKAWARSDACHRTLYRACTVKEYRCVWRFDGEGPGPRKTTCKRRGTRRTVSFNWLFEPA